MFQLVEVPIALPGSCYLCSSGTKSPFIDWGVSIEFHGALYTCFECTAAVASLLGMATAEQHKKDLQEIDRLMADNLELTVHNRALKNVISSLDIAGVDTSRVDESLSHITDQPIGSIADLGSDILEHDSSSDESARETDELLDSGEGTSDESGNDEGMDELRPTTKRTDYKLSI